MKLSMVIVRGPSLERSFFLLLFHSNTGSTPTCYRAVYCVCIFDVPFHVALRIDSLLSLACYPFPIQTTICLIILHSFPTCARSSAEFSTNIFHLGSLSLAWRREFRGSAVATTFPSTSRFVLHYSGYHRPFPFVRHLVCSFLIISICPPFFSHLVPIFLKILTPSFLIVSV